MYLRDTIAAIATPLGEGGIGIVRISGDAALDIAGRIFSGKRNGGLASHRFYYGELLDPASGAALDEVMLVAMRAPRSYTREDVVEIHCHGGYLLVQQVLALVLRQGARLAQAGEFTQRAFLNGRIDLIQAEAVIEVIRSKTEASLNLANHQLTGLLSQRLGMIRTGLLEALAVVEAYIDFPEEDLEGASAEQVEGLVGAALAETASLLAGYREGRVLREGVSVIIAGKPNVGKSSLLNALLREKRAIVTAVPGTTRDVIEEIVTIGGLPVRLLDTAGIRESGDEVEQEGMRMTLERLPQADLVLFVLDGSRSFDEDDARIAQEIAGACTLAVVNKSDLPHCLAMPDALTALPMVAISARAGTGLEVLRTAIFNEFVQGTAIDSREYVAISQARHRSSLEQCREQLGAVLASLRTGIGLELVAVDLRSALHALGEVTGETTPDEVLDLIFSRFCIGK
jgi:tRNA modification GTPase